MYRFASALATQGLQARPKNRPRGADEEDGIPMTGNLSRGRV